MDRVRFNPKEVRMAADSLLGLEYEKAGRGPGKVDCYGLMILFYRAFEIEMPDFLVYETWDDKEEYYLDRYSSVSRRLSAAEEPMPGDFVLFKNVEGTSNHAGIYVGDGEFIHSYRNVGVKRESLNRKPWKNKVNGFFRLKAAE